jgi:FKBP-type peptidyl-prolyl cis-trans isomerase
MLSPRLVVPVLAGALALCACSDNSSEPTGGVASQSKPSDKPAAAQPAKPAPAAEQPAPAAPAATPPAASKPAAPAATPAEKPAAAPAEGALPASGDPTAKRDPEFYLPPDSALTTTPSGLKFLVIREGSGTPPKAEGSFTAHYCGWYTNGEVFDSSYSRNEPLSYPVNRMILGWREALVMMKPGSEYILVVPPELGYGAGGNGIRPDSTLVFRMELLTASG